ncbi:hypothetical protein ACMGGR_12030 [Erwinia sp. BNK-24-b]|uniref:hypothetical protein n=1 Tax=Erwinia TaxID=551 RepID=UPI001FEE6A91|nr:hypothetical protein [Erwinia phyllosphaerae]MBV4366398.1 hypothetical protein [Erwinia phyllosphaerae]
MAVICIPPLTGLLMDAECRKGTSLTRQEVEKIRDSTTTVSVPDGIAKNMDPFCGYGDIDPQKCWETWLRYRAAVRMLTV